MPIVFSAAALDITKSGVVPQGGYEEFVADLAAIAYTFDPRKKYRFEVAASDSSGALLSSYVVADSTQVDPPAQQPLPPPGSNAPVWHQRWLRTLRQPQVYWTIAAVVTLIAVGLAIAKFGKPSSMKSDKSDVAELKSEIERLRQEVQTTKAAKVATPAAVTPPATPAPTPAMTAPLVMTNNEVALRALSSTGTVTAIATNGNATIIYGNVNGGVNQSGQGPQRLGWPHQWKPGQTFDILTAEQAKDTNMVKRSFTCKVPINKDYAFRYPISPYGNWMVYPRDDGDYSTEAAFNQSTEQDPEWVLTKDYRGGIINSLRIHNYGDRDVTVTFRLELK